MTNLEYQDGGRIVLQDVSAFYEQYQKEIIATKARGIFKMQKYELLIDVHIVN